MSDVILAVWLCGGVLRDVAARKEQGMRRRFVVATSVAILAALPIGPIATTDAGYTPECADIFYYFNPFCWLP